MSKIINETVLTNDFDKGAGGRWISPSHYNQRRELFSLDCNPCTNPIDQVNKREYDPKHESYYACFCDAYHEYKLPKFVTEEIEKISMRVVVQPR
jgi:hypothetical protein